MMAPAGGTEHGDAMLRVGAADRDRVAALLARAFYDDPEMVYAFPGDGERARLLPWLIGLNVGYSLRYGEVYVTPGWEAAALWLPPGRTRFTPWRMLRAGMVAAPLRLRWHQLRRLAALGARTAGMQQRHTSGPHWYLAQIGVEPACQHQGIGSELLRPMLARCDAEGSLCYLETANAANVGLYQHFGFVVAEVIGPGGSIPGMWAMRREPRHERQP